LGNFGNDKSTLVLGKVGFLQIVKMRWDDIFFFIQETLVSGILGLLMYFFDELINPFSGCIFLFFVRLPKISVLAYLR